MAMSGRDHSIECNRCGMWYGGMLGPDNCECPDGPQPAFDPASINLTSCDFVGDMGCTDEACTHCHGFYPRHPLGLSDHGEYVAAKPCAKRLNTIPISWCTRPNGHEPPCSAPIVAQIEESDFGPEASKRRRW